MSDRFFAQNSSGETLEIIALSSGLTNAIDPTVTHSQPFAGSDHFRSASGQQVRQTRPGVFVLDGSDVQYERVIEGHA